MNFIILFAKLRLFFDFTDFHVFRTSFVTSQLVTLVTLRSIFVLQIIIGNITLLI